MPTRSPLPLVQAAANNRAAVLQGLLIAAIVICGLYFGQDVLLPLAVAILLSFVLTPPLLWLQRIKVPRVLAVVIVVVVAFSILGGLGWLISREATNLATDLPSYSATLSQKIKMLRETTTESQVLKKAGDVLADLEAELEGAGNPQGKSQIGQITDGVNAPIPVEIREPAPTGLDYYRSIAGTVLPPLATTGIILLFVVFILLQREELRDRLIRLFGGSNLQSATSTMTEAATRLSHYFLSQVLVNSAYGIFIGIALGSIGMPSPIAWGILAMVMRFVPYVGSYIAAAIPVLIAAAIDPGWSLVLMVAGLFIVGEFTMGEIIEPLIYGRGTGVTPIAVIGSTVFWTWLWGPLGLIIATPITVVLAVLGRHVEGLRFFDVLLGDRPALSPEESFYRFSLVGHGADATYQAELALKDQSLLSYLDEVALGGLRLADRDVARGTLDAAHAEQVAQAVSEVLENLDEYEPKRWFARVRRKLEKKGVEAGVEAPADTSMPEDEDDYVVAESDFAPGWDRGTPILCIGGRSRLDKAAAEMLTRVLEKRALKADLLGPDALEPARIDQLARTEAKLVCLSYLGFGSGPVQIRYLVRRLRRILPKGTLIIVAYWDQEEANEAVMKLLDVVHADACAGTLHEAVKLCEEAAMGKLEPAKPSTQPNGDRVALASTPPQDETARTA